VCTVYSTRHGRVIEFPYIIKGYAVSCPQAPVMRMGYIHDGRVNYIRELYLHDRPANRQRMRMGYIHDGRVNYTRELYLHDRPANRQRTRMGHIHDGRVNYTRELYLHDRPPNRQRIRKGYMHDEFTRPSCIYPILMRCLFGGRSCKYNSLV
jgi:hypothetical protein